MLRLFTEKIRPAFLAMIAFCITLTAPSAFADSIELKDGRVYHGKLVKKNDDIITFDIVQENLKQRKMFLTSHVMKLVEGNTAPAKPKPKLGADGKPIDPKNPAKAVETGPTYFVVPLYGEFGLEIKASIIAQALEVAKKAKPDTIVLKINSGGGEVGEMLAIMDLLQKWRRTETIPLVAFIEKQAFSAAAITALSTKTIYMKPASAMGAALIVEVGANGAVRSLDSTAVGEKYSSAIRAQVRTAAEAAGHSPLITEAMMHAETELSYARDKNDQVVILRGHPKYIRVSGLKTPPKLLIARDRLLSMTPNEAEAVGVSAGTVNDLAALGNTLGKPGWRANDAGVAIVDKHVKKIAKNIKDYDASFKRIKLGISKFRQAGGGQLSTMERSISASRVMLIRIERMAKENNYIASRAARDFPEGFDYYKGIFDSLLGRIREYKRQLRQLKR